jgi:hypothetical protein
LLLILSIAHCGTPSKEVKNGSLGERHAIARNLEAVCKESATKSEHLDVVAGRDRWVRNPTR